MKRKLLLTCFSLLIWAGLSAQCNTPNFPFPPGNSCNDATFFCDNEINGYCSTLPTGGADGPNPLCPGAGVPNNIHWMAFAAGSTTINLEIIPDNCEQTGQMGIQAGVYDNCDFQNSIACEGNCQTNTFNLNLTNLNVGQVYFLLIDGCAGNVCDYEINVTTGTTAAPAPQGPIQPIDGPGTVCDGLQGVAYSVPPVTFGTNYFWTLPPGATYIETNDLGNEILVDWGSVGGQVCVDVNNDCHPALLGQTCFDVVMEPTPMSTINASYCNGGCYFYGPTGECFTGPGPHVVTLTNASFAGCDSIVNISLTSFDLPPFDLDLDYCTNEGCATYDGDGQCYSEGLYSVTFFGASFQGCDSTVNLTVTQLLNTEEFIEAAICAGETYEVCGGLPYDIEDNYQIGCNPNFAGCDSTIYLELYVLDPIAAVEPPPLLGCGNNASVYLDGFSSFGDEFLWETFDGEICDNPTNLFLEVCLPGTYCLTATSTHFFASGAQFSCTDQICVEVLPNTEQPMTMVSTTDVGCPGQDNGSATITVSNTAIGPFTYDWDPLVSVGNTATDLAAGTYNVTVTSESNGCFTIEEIIIGSAPPIAITTTQNNIACNGGSTGTATATPTGGSGGFTYAWCNGQTTQTATGLPVGVCQVIVTDANGCTNSASVTITEASPMAVSIVPTNAACNGASTGSAVASASGGTAPYTYAWSNSQSGDTATGLNANTYTVTATDSQGCTFVQTTTISEPPPVTATTQQTNLLCDGDANGTATVNPAGGIGGFTFSWCNSQTTATATDLPSGPCQVIVTDGNGCTFTATVTITAPNPIGVSATFTDVQCFGASDGTATATVTGGTGSPSYAWCNGQSTATATGLDVGTCTVTVTDGNGCTAETSVTLAGPASALDITGMSVDAACGDNNGSVSINVTGGTPNYTYLWSNGNTTDNPTNLGPGGYTVTVTDDNDCTATFSATVNTPTGLEATIAATPVSCNGGSDGTVTVTVQGGTGPFNYVWDSNEIADDETTGSDLPADDYNVTVSDASGCTFVASATITQPTLITISGNSTDENCGEGDGTISTNVQGGTGPYSYTWLPEGTGPNPTGLSAGNYSLEVTDDNGCTATFNIAVNTPGALVVEAIGTDAECNGEPSGTIQTTVTGGVAPFAYEWTGGLGDNENPDEVPAGTYTLVVTDDTGCSVTTSVEIGEPEMLAMTSVSNQATCGDDNGSISITVTGGTEPYEYDWSSGDDTDNPTGLVAGTYTVLITDANDCELTQTVEVTTPDAIELTVSAQMTSCFNGADGAIDLEVTGGTAPFTYDWSGPIVQDPMNLTAGQYTVVVTDNNDCTATISIEVEQPEELEIQATSSDASCGQSNGSITSFADGGTAPYTYEWSNGAGTDQSPDGLSPGSYEGVVTDANGCTASTTVNVETPAGLALTLTPTAVLCNGAATGAIDLEVAGGIAPFTYEWDNGETTQDITGLVAGSYGVVVTDATGCTIVATSTVAQPDAIELSNTIIEATCGDANGGISLTVIGGTSPYEFAWSNGSMNQNPTNLTADDYDVVVTDANGCTAILATTVTTPPVLEATATQINVSCNGGADGSVDLEVTGGTAPFTYQWTGGSTDEDPADFTAGDVTGTVTDANGCTASVSLTLTEPDPITFSATSEDATCGENNGSIDATVLGGTAPYTYLWNGTITGEDPTDLLAGNYDVVVTDFNGCTAEFSTTVNTPNALTADAVVTDASCNSENSGAINVSVSGGVEPFSYDWVGTGWNGEDLIDYTADTYTLIITDATGCSISLTETIAEPTAIEITGTSTDALCGQDNGTVDITVLGGTPPYTYVWSNGDLNEDPSNLPIGNYNVIVTDANLCEQQFDIAVSTPNGLALIPSFTNVSCNGGADGTASVSAQGGTAPFTYVWSTGAIDTDMVMDLPAGSVGVTVTDADGCVVTSSSIIGQPDAIVINGNTTNETCNLSNGTATITVNGGTSPYTFAWSDGSTNQNPDQLAAGPATVTVTDINGCTMEETFVVDAPNALAGSTTPTNVSCNGEADGSISPAIFGGVGPYEYLWNPGMIEDQVATGLTAGDYTLQVTDANGCVFELQQTITEPPALLVTGTSTDALCGEEDGTIDITVEGGTAPYSYNWSNGTTSEDQPGVAAGSYIVTVTDNNDCEFVYEIPVNTPSLLVASATGTDALCFGNSDGMATSTVTGGTSPFTYEWSNGDLTEDLIDVSAGDYVLSVTDATGCTVTASVTIGEPAALAITGESTDALCDSPEGTVTIEVTGGTTPYTYLWDNGATTQNIADLPADVYSVVVTDANGCTIEFTETVSIPDAVEIADVIEDANCNDSSDGSIDIEPIGGIAPFTYSWDNGATTQDINNLSAGTYNVTVIDGNDCEVSFSFIVGAPALLEVFEVGATSDVSCNGGNDGSIQIDVAGGTGPFSFDWDNAPDVQNPTSLTAGIYNVVVTDANGCTAITSAEITQPDPLVLSSVATDVDCNTSTNGTVDLTVSGGIEPYSYNWNNGTSEEDIDNLSAGTYQVEVTDANGCTDVSEATVTAPEAVELTVSAVSEFNNFNVSCSNSTDGFATVQVSGGVPNYTFEWSSGDTLATAENLVAGTYTVTAFDANGCPSELVSVTLEAPAALDAIAIIQDVICFGDSDGAIIIDDVIGGAAPYAYALDGGDFNQFGLFGNLSAGQYELTIQDANGCEETFTQTVSENSELSVDLFVSPTPMTDIETTDEVEIQLGESTDIIVDFNRDTADLQQFGWTQGLYWEDMGCDTCQRRTVLPTETTLYEYVIVDENGCVGRDELLLKVIKDRQVYIPNAFSPNADGNNDYFQIYPSGEVANIEFFKIYNRWGEVVYELSDFFVMEPMEGWDGRFKGEFLNPGVYVYHAQVLYKDGRIELLKGDVTLMR